MTTTETKNNTATTPSSPWSSSISNSDNNNLQHKPKESAATNKTRHPYLLLRRVGDPWLQILFQNETYPRSASVRNSWPAFRFLVASTLFQPGGGTPGDASYARFATFPHQVLHGDSLLVHPKSLPRWLPRDTEHLEERTNRGITETVNERIKYAWTVMCTFNLLVHIMQQHDIAVILVAQRFECVQARCNVCGLTCWH